jgi:hypothetical protein
MKIPTLHGFVIVRLPDGLNQSYFIISKFTESLTEIPLIPSELYLMVYLPGLLS